MKSLLMRTGSMPVLNRLIPSGSSSSKSKMTPTTTLSRNNSVDSLSGGKISIEVKKSNVAGIRRVSSESDVIRSERMLLKSVGSKSNPSPARIPEDIDEAEEEEVGEGIRFSDGWGSLTLPVEEERFSGGGGGGSGFNGGYGNNGNGYGYDDKSKIGDYYRKMLKSHPNNSLLLMNYGKFLYEVEKDAERAEEYYGRAILENPGDGEALSMYGKLIWETKKDEKRAQCYFDQAVHASPDDCMVLGSYAHFMWDAEDEDEEEEENELMVASPAMVSAV